MVVRGATARRRVGVDRQLRARAPKQHRAASALGADRQEDGCEHSPWFC